MHTMLAGMVNVEELALEKEEAKMLAESVVEVGAFYNMEVPAKAAAWTNLIMVAGALYGPRIVVARGKLRTARANGPMPMPPKGSVAPRAETPAASGATVIDIPGVGRVAR